MTWGYTAPLEPEQQPQPVAAALSMAPEPKIEAFSPEQIDALKAQFMELLKEQQTNIITAMTIQGIQGPQEVAAYLQNAMNATATGLDLAIERGELAKAQSAGRTGVNGDDVARVVAQAEAVTAQTPFAITAPQPQQISPFASVSLTSVALAGNNEFPFADLGSTTAALANNDFRPLDTPNLARGQELGRFA